MQKGKAHRLHLKGAQSSSRYCLRPDPVKSLFSTREPLASRHSPTSENLSKALATLVVNSAFRCTALTKAITGAQAGRNRTLDLSER